MNAGPEVARPARPSIRLGRFGLRTLLALVVVAAVALSWLTADYRAKRAAVARLEKLGAVVTYQHDWIPPGQWREVVPPGHPWLRAILGENYAAEIVEVGLFGGAPGMTPDEFTDADAALLARVSTLRRITLRGTRLTDEGLMKLAAIPALIRVDAIDGRLTPRGVERFRELRPDVRVAIHWGE